MSSDDTLQVRVAAPSIDAIRDLTQRLRSTGVVERTQTTLALETIFEKTGIGYVAGAAAGRNGKHKTSQNGHNSASHANGQHGH